MRVHFVAISGTGMGALAGLFKAAGHNVTGSDIAFYPPMGPALRAWGIQCFEGFDPAHLDPLPDLVVVGNACKSSNVEAKAALEVARSGGKVTITSMAHALADHILAGTSPLVVGGTHGKTTTSSIAAFLLHEAGRDPGFLIGGLPKDFPESFRLPGRERRLGLMNEQGTPQRRTPFVVEGDEYDTAFFEKTPKLWHYRPEVGIITSIEHDHVDIYPDEASYLAAFEGFVERIPTSGLLVANAADRRVVDLVSRKKNADGPEIAWFALDGEDTHGMPPHWLAAPVTAGPNGQSFDLYAGGTFAGRVALSVPGRHNIKNALAALAATVQGYGLSLSAAMEALPRFSGVKRRQELLFEESGIRVYDDFAHHPTAVHETVSAIRAKHPEGTLWTVFEPRTATSCRAMHQTEYEQAFKESDRVILAPVGRPEIPAAERLDTNKIVAAIHEQGKDALAASSVDAIIETIVMEATPGDTVLLLSNGAFGGIYEKLRTALSSRPESFSTGGSMTGSTVCCAAQ